MGKSITDTEREIVTMYCGLNKRGKERVMDMFYIAMHYCNKSSRGGNVYDVAEWKQGKSNGRGQDENQGHIHREGAK